MRDERFSHDASDAPLYPSEKTHEPISDEACTHRCCYMHDVAMEIAIGIAPLGIAIGIAFVYR